MSRYVTLVVIAVLSASALVAPTLAAPPSAPVPPVGVWVCIPRNPFDPTPSNFSEALRAGQKAIALTAAPEEWECGTFYVNPPRDMGIIAAMPSNLVMGKSVITKDNVEVWTVHNMPLGAGDSKAKLLVKAEPAMPSLYGAKTTGDAKAEFKPGMVKQMWVRVYVPKRTKVGTYNGAITLISSTGASSKVPLQMTVRGMRLLMPSKRYASLNYYYPNPLTDETVAPQPSVPTSRPISQATYVAMLKNLKAHGVNSCSISDPVSNLFDSLKMYKENGMENPVLYTGLGAWDDPPDEEKVKAIEKERKTLGLPEVLYSPSDAPITGDSQLEPLKAQLLEITRKAWSKSAALLADDAAFTALGECVTARVYALESPRVRKIITGEERRAKDRAEYYYYDAANASPIANRVNVGVLLWKSGLDGVYLVCEPPDEHPGQTISYGGPAKLIYIGKDTVMNSLNMDAIREGIDDVRYITTMMCAIREAKDLKRVPELTSAAESYLKSFLNKPSDKLTYADLQTFRGKVAVYAAKIRQAVGGA